MTALAKQAGTCKWEKLRRVRYGDVLKLIRSSPEGDYLALLVVEVVEPHCV
jgi:hypothetical protein